MQHFNFIISVILVYLDFLDFCILFQLRIYFVLATLFPVQPPKLKTLLFFAFTALLCSIYCDAYVDKGVKMKVHFYQENKVSLPPL